jgi:hypothetical protein
MPGVFLVRFDEIQEKRKLISYSNLFRKPKSDASYLGFDSFARVEFPNFATIENHTNKLSKHVCLLFEIEFGFWQAFEKFTYLRVYTLYVNSELYKHMINIIKKHMRFN